MKLATFSLPILLVVITTVTTTSTVDISTGLGHPATEVF
jgi:hypothetical protein